MGYPGKHWGTSPAFGLDMWAHFLGSYFLPPGSTFHGPLHFLNPNPSSHTATAAPHSSPPTSPSWGGPWPLSSLIQVWPSLLSLPCRETFSHGKSQLPAAVIADESPAVASVALCRTCTPALLFVVEPVNIWMGGCIVFLSSCCLIISGRCSSTNKAWVSHGQLRFLEDSQRMSVVSAVTVSRSSMFLHLPPACAKSTGAVPFLSTTFCSSSFWESMDIALGALGKSGCTVVKPQVRTICTGVRSNDG